MTTDGGIFVRVAGASPSVKDPRVLAELYGRGAVARMGALERSLNALNNVQRSRHRFASFGAATIGGSSPLTSPIYRPHYADELEDVFRTQLGDVIGLASVERFMDHRKVVIRGLGGTIARCELEAQRDGSVAVHYWGQRGASFAPRDVVVGGDYVGAAWRSMVQTLLRAGATGRMHLRIGVLDEFGIPGAQSINLERWVDLGMPGADQIESIHRDLRRSAGEWVEEPEAAEN